MTDRATDWAAQYRGPRWWTVEQARHLLQRIDDSGQSVSAFARRIGVSAKRIYWWRRQLGDRLEQRCDVSVETSTPQFVPVVVRTTRPPSSVERPPLSVRLGEQFQVDVYLVDQSTASWIAVLAAELGARVSQ